MSRVLMRAIAKNKERQGKAAAITLEVKQEDVPGIKPVKKTRKRTAKRRARGRR